jgi:hypothetical protein
MANYKQRSLPAMAPGELDSIKRRDRLERENQLPTAMSLCRDVRDAYRLFWAKRGRNVQSECNPFVWGTR